MTIVPQVPARVVLRKLERAAFRIVHQRGSHVKLFHPHSKRKVTIPVHPGDIGKKLIGRILKQAGLTVEDFLEL
jgi:mRNA interferase HicA